MAVRMRGEILIAFGSLFIVLSLFILIFPQIGQLNASVASRNTFVMSVDVSKLGAALAESLGHSISDLYNTSNPVILRQHLGLRQQYKWGLHGYCAYSKSSNSLLMGCVKGTLDTVATPIDAILGDIPSTYTSNVTALMGSSAFTDSRYLLNIIRTASIFVFIGVLSLACNLLCGVVKSTTSFFLAVIFNLISVLSLVIGVSIWTALVHKVSNVPLGIEVQQGSGILLMWAAVVPAIFAFPLYMIICATYRG